MKMIRFLCLMIFFYSITPRASAEFVIPEDISEALSHGGIGESGGFSPAGIDPGRFDEYIRGNWRLIVNDIASLPAWSSKGLSSPDRKESTRANFGVACECLPPLEYLEFLDKWVDLAAAKKINLKTLEGSLSYWSGRKRFFLAANRERPEVKKIITRILRLMPPTEEFKDFTELLERTSTGELTGSYMALKPDDNLFPEFLPGTRQGKAREIPDYSVRRYTAAWLWIAAAALIAVVAIVALVWKKRSGDR